MDTLELPRAARTADNPYLTGVHAPMREELTLTQLQVSGRIPPALRGRYLRMGPNPIGTTAASAGKYHWFAGDGMVHGIRLQDGAALWYRNRWVRSTHVSKVLGEARAPGPRHLFDTVNTNVLGFGGRTYGLVEAGSTPVLLGEDLHTLAYTDLDGTLHGGLSAHPHLDPLTGEMIAVSYDAAKWRSVRYLVITPAGRVRRAVRIPVRHGPMIHDCAFTRRFAIVFDLPVTFSLRAALSGYAFPYRWNPDHPARVGLLPREGEADDIGWFRLAPCFIFHALNAYDTPQGAVVLDVVVHDRMFWQRTSGPDSQACRLERWTFEPLSGTIERTTLDPTAQEFPRIDERRLGQPYRYAYTMALRDPFLGTALFKHDLVEGRRQTHDFGPARHPCEFVFVPKHEGADEDDGWLMGFVINAAAGATDLVILDARAFADPPVASVRVPHVIPPGFHGNWVADPAGNA